ncbi:hypothetical protein DXG01_009957 [Tephrocybe rancida]|nr:hypothetical protein DXG01_009957 [Tephrocybe rancida]
MATDAEFLQRIAVVENELLALDYSSVDDFNHQWNALVDDLRVAMYSKSLRSTTVKIAHSLANRVSLVIQSFLDLEALAESLMSSLLDDPEPTNKSVSTLPSEPNSSAHPYLKPSYEWLVENIHNPYPSTRVRDAIALKSGAARKDVDNWFIDARKRIGWNAARKTHFSNKRVDIVDAATRFYADDEKLALGQDAELALVSIMKNTKDLYSDKFDETPLATKLATVVKDLTPQTKAEAKAERLRQSQLKKDRDSYPSPDRSPEPTRLSPVPCDDEVDNAASQPISTTNRKRRSSSVEALDVDQDEGSRPAKRCRFDPPSSSPKATSIPLGLPSPAASVDEPLLAVESLIPYLPPSIPVTSGRKRRLSESDGQSAPKRPRNIAPGPRLQTVSDPLPLSSNFLFGESSFDGWFQQAFDRPEIGEISPSGFSVELCNLSDFDCDTPATSRSASPEHSEQLFEPPTIEVAEIPSTEGLWPEYDFGWTDNLFVPSEVMAHSLVNVVGQPLPAPLTQDLSNFELHGLPSSSDLESIYNLSDPTIVNPAVIPLNPASSQAWDFSLPPVIPQDDAFGKHNGGFGVSDGCFSPFDYTIDGANLLPSSDTIYLTTPQDKVRQEKEKEFREAYEKAQRLALELQGGDLYVS